MQWWSHSCCMCSGGQLQHPYSHQYNQHSCPLMGRCALTSKPWDRWLWSSCRTASAAKTDTTVSRWWKAFWGSTLSTNITGWATASDPLQACWARLAAALKLGAVTSQALLPSLLCSRPRKKVVGSAVLLQARRMLPVLGCGSSLLCGDLPRKAVVLVSSRFCAKHVLRSASGCA
jgi:hypothetical protein